MLNVDKIYINGEFVEPHGRELFNLYNPTTGQITGTVRLGDAEDVDRAVAAAKSAFPNFAQTSKDERIDMLMAMHAAVSKHADRIKEEVVREYGGPVKTGFWLTTFAVDAFREAAETLAEFPLTRRVAKSEVVMQPVGIAGLIMPWNDNCHAIASKLSLAFAAGCTMVIKPSEMSARQTQVLLEILHEVGLPKGVFNVVNGRGDVVGNAITSHPDISKLSFTGSTPVGKSIMRAGADTVKRVTLELGGKSPQIVLDDAELEIAVPQIIAQGLANNGQACINGTRVLLPRTRAAELSAAIADAVSKLKVGDPRDPDTDIGPAVSSTQHARVARYIRTGIEEGGKVLAGGEGKPKGLENGFFTKRPCSAM